MTMTRPFIDPAFLDRLRRREEAAVREVVHLYLPQVLRAARGGGLTDEESRDVAQSTFVTFIEKLPVFEARSHVRTFLFGILYRKIHELYRARRRDNMYDDIDEVVESRFDAKGHWSSPPRTRDEAELSELRSDIEECLGLVPRRQRLAFILREVQGFTTEEMCNILTVSVTNLGVMLHRARNRLRECLEGKGVGI